MTRLFYALQGLLIVGTLVGFTVATGSILVAYAAAACGVISGSLGIAYGQRLGEVVRKRPSECDRTSSCCQEGP